MKYKLDLFNISNLARELEAIPLNTTELNLCKISCYSADGVDHPLTAALLLKILKASPETVDTINLSINNLGGCYDGRRFSTAQLITILKELPKGVIRLNLSHNHLHWLSADDFVEVLGALPAQLKSLNLASNSLENYSAADLIKILKALPQDLESLYLDNIHFGERFLVTETIEILKALPKKLTLLSLSDNSLHRYSYSEQVQIISSLPKQLKHLNLANALWKLMNNNLSQLFAVLPKSLVSLNLSHNGLGCFSAQELLQAFSNLCTDHLTSLFLSANYFKESQIVALLPFLASSKIKLLELKSTWLQNDNGYKDLSKEISYQIQKILWSNRKKLLINPKSANDSKIYSLQALCGIVVTFFTIPFDSNCTVKEVRDIIFESERLIETEGLKVGIY